MSGSHAPHAPGRAARRRQSRRRFLQAAALARSPRSALTRLATRRDLPPRSACASTAALGLRHRDRCRHHDARSADEHVDRRTSRVTLQPVRHARDGRAGPVARARRWRRPGDCSTTGPGSSSCGRGSRSTTATRSRHATSRFTISRTLDPAEQTAVDTVFSTVERIETPDDLTVRFVTCQPDPLLPARLAFVGGQILPERYFKQVGPTDSRREPVGSGPIKLVAWVPNDFSMFAANDRRIGAARRDFDRVVFKRDAARARSCAMR